MRQINQFYLTIVLSIIIVTSASAQDYFFKDNAPFNTTIPSPESFLGYPIGERHTRHDQIVAYLSKLAELCL